MVKQGFIMVKIGTQLKIVSVSYGYYSTNYKASRCAIFWDKNKPQKGIIVLWINLWKLTLCTVLQRISMRETLQLRKIQTAGGWTYCNQSKYYKKHRKNMTRTMACLTSFHLSISLSLSFYNKTISFSLVQFCLLN